MNQPSRRPTARSFAAMASAILWGLVEVVALARSRWSIRRRAGRDMTSPG
jgi:hypothetical protein